MKQVVRGKHKAPMQKSHTGTGVRTVVEVVVRCEVEVAAAVRRCPKSAPLHVLQCSVCCCYSGWERWGVKWCPIAALSTPPQVLPAPQASGTPPRAALLARQRL